MTVFVYNASGQLVAEYSTEISQAPKVSYTTDDHLGSPRILTDETGATISAAIFISGFTMGELSTREFSPD